MKLIPLVFALFLALNLNAQKIKDYEWLAIGEAEKYINLTGMDADEKGNLYLCGRNEKNARFYSANGSSFAMQEGHENFYYQFLTSYSPKGSVRWVQAILPRGGNSGQSYYNAVATDKQGHVYVAGATRSSALFTSADGKDSLTRSQRDYKAFVAKYDTDGNLIWLRIHPKYRHALNLSIDDQNHVIAWRGQAISGSVLWVWKLDGEGETLFDHRIQSQRYSTAVSINKKGVVYLSLRDYKAHQYDLVKWELGKDFDTLHHFDYTEGPDIYTHDNGLYTKYVTNFEYINHIGFDKKGEPLFFTRMGFSGWKKKRALGRTFVLDSGSKVLIHYDDQFKIKWFKQFNDANYNTELTVEEDGSFLYRSPAYYNDSFHNELFQPGKYANQFIQELVYRYYDADGNLQWVSRGGGTASNYHASKQVKVGDDWYVASDILDYAYLNEDTLRGSMQQTSMYIGKIGKKNREDEKREAKNESVTALGDTITPYQDSLMANQQESKQGQEEVRERKSESEQGIISPRSDEKPERKIDLLVYPNPNQGVFTLKITSDKKTTVHIMLTDMQGKQLYAKKHQVMPGENMVKFDIRQEAPAYYLLKVMESGRPFTVRVGKR